MVLLNCKIHSYHIRIRIKHKQTPESSDILYYALERIKNMSYESPQNTNRRRKIGDYWFSMDFKSFGEKNENITKIEFLLGRETRENFPLKNRRGQHDFLRIPPGSNLCFDTRGAFFFKKIEGEWECILCMERRFSAAGLSKLLEYIKKINPQYSFDVNPITVQTNYIQKINSIRELSWVIIKNQPFTFSRQAGMGTILAERRENDELTIKEARIEIKGEESTMEKLKKFIKRYKRRAENQEISNQEIKEIIDETELVLVKREGGRYFNVPLFEELFLFNMKVRLIPSSRQFDNEDFFTKFNHIITQGKINELFRLTTHLT